MCTSWSSMKAVRKGKHVTPLSLKSTPASSRPPSPTIPAPVRAAAPSPETITPWASFFLVDEVQQIGECAADDASPMLPAPENTCKASDMHTVMTMTASVGDQPLDPLHVTIPVSPSPGIECGPPSNSLEQMIIEVPSQTSLITILPSQDLASMIANLSQSLLDHIEAKMDKGFESFCSRLLSLESSWQAWHALPEAPYSPSQPQSTLWRPHISGPVDLPCSEYDDFNVDFAYIHDQPLLTRPSNSTQQDAWNDVMDTAKSWKSEVLCVYCRVYSIPPNVSDHSLDTDSFEEHMIEFHNAFGITTTSFSNLHIPTLKDFIADKANQSIRLHRMAVAAGLDPEKVEPPVCMAPAAPCLSGPQVSFACIQSPLSHAALHSHLRSFAAAAGHDLALPAEPAHPPIATLPPAPPSPTLSVSIHGWETVGKPRKPAKRSRGLAKPSPGQAGSAPMKATSSGPAAPLFMLVVAAAPLKAVAPLSKAALDKLTHHQAVSTFNACFGTTYTVSDITKEGIISSYLSRVAVPLRPRARADKLPTLTSEWTLVHSQDALPIQGPHPDAAQIVCGICQDIASLHNPSATLKLQLLSRRWSSQTSPNFVFVFAGQPESKLVMKYHHSLTRPFGASCRLAPQKGYSHIMLHRIRTFCTANSFNGTLPTHAVLWDELAANPLWCGVQLLTDIRWVNPANAISKSHSSIVVAYLDVDGSLTKNMLKNPPYMFGERTAAKIYTAMPLLRQCSICHSLRHDADHCACKGAIICPICGGRHSVDKHAISCPHKAKHKIAGQCNCALSCLNCRNEGRKPFASHISTDLSCPLQKKFCTETH